MKETYNRGNKNILLLSTHFINNKIINLYKKIKKDVSTDNYEVVILYNGKMLDLNSHVKDVNVFLWDRSFIDNIGYHMIASSIFPGSCHFPLLNFYLNYPNYDFFWFIEYDVWFTGNWSSLISDCDKNLKDIDFLSSHIESFNDANLNWGWWYKYNNSGYKYNKCIKGFNPICRYSLDALKFIDKYQRKGFYAHSEVLITTCLFHNGFKLCNFGGNTSFTPENFHNKYYIQERGVNNGTIRWRPVYHYSEILNSNLNNILFHPFKE